MQLYFCPVVTKHIASIKIKSISNCHMLSENQNISQSEMNLPCVNVEKDIMLIHTLDTGQFCLSGLCFPELTADILEITSENITQAQYKLIHKEKFYYIM